jgi:glc operon protein GlcG
MKSRPMLTQSDVQRLLQEGESYARARSWNVTLAVCDDGGHALGLLRMDGASPFTARMAQEKGRTAALTRRESRHYEQVVKERNAFLSAPDLHGLIEGGLPVLVEGHCVGAVGVSGVKSTEDAQIAQAAISALLGGSEPAR